MNSIGHILTLVLGVVAVALVVREMRRQDGFADGLMALGLTLCLITFLPPFAPITILTICMGVVVKVRCGLDGWCLAPALVWIVGLFVWGEYESMA